MGKVFGSFGRLEAAYRSLLLYIIWASGVLRVVEVFCAVLYDFGVLGLVRVLWIWRLSDPLHLGLLGVVEVLDFLSSASLAVW